MRRQGEWTWHGRISCACSMCTIINTLACFSPALSLSPSSFSSPLCNTSNLITHFSNARLRFTVSFLSNLISASGTLPPPVVTGPVFHSFPFKPRTFNLLISLPPPQCPSKLNSKFGLLRSWPTMRRISKRVSRLSQFVFLSSKIFSISFLLAHCRLFKNPHKHGSYLRYARRARGCRRAIHRSDSS